IMTPFEADLDWTKGGHVFRDIDGSAFDRIFRVSGHSTVLENFRLASAGGSTADAGTMGFAVEFLGPNTVCRNGSITRRSTRAGGVGRKEGVGLACSIGWDGAHAENIVIGNPIATLDDQGNPVPEDRTVGIGVGGGPDEPSRGVTLKNIKVFN